MRFAVGGWRHGATPFEVGGAALRALRLEARVGRHGDKETRRRGEKIGGHPSSPYGLRRDKEDRKKSEGRGRKSSVFALRATPRQGGRRQRTERNQKSEGRGQRAEVRCASRLEVGGALRLRLEVIRLRPTGYAATRRTEDNCELRIANCEFEGLTIVD